MKNRVSPKKQATVVISFQVLQFSVQYITSCQYHIKAPLVISLKDTDELPFVYQEHVDPNKKKKEM